MSTNHNEPTIKSRELIKVDDPLIKIGYEADLVERDDGTFCMLATRREISTPDGESESVHTEFTTGTMEEAKAKARELVYMMRASNRYALGIADHGLPEDLEHRAKELPEMVENCQKAKEEEDLRTKARLTVQNLSGEEKVRFLKTEFEVKQRVIRDFVVMKTNKLKGLDPVTICYLPLMLFHGFPMTYNQAINRLLQHPDKDHELVATITTCYAQTHP